MACGQSIVSSIERPLIRQRDMLGHTTIDDDHRAIAGAWQHVIHCEPLQFPFLIARLKKLMRMHFDHEAALMHSAGGMLCECHRMEHRAFLALCDEAAALSETNWRRTQSLLRNKLPKMIRSHIACMDQIAVLFINANGAVPASR